MYEILIDALVDTAKMIPLLVFIYIGIELIEIKLGDKMTEKVKSAGKAGPAIGAGLGCVPQCGFSVMATALYTKRAVSVGTLLAVYISTSDEAIPVILAQPNKVNLILPLIITKIIIAIIAGYGINLILKIMNSASPHEEVCATSHGESHVHSCECHDNTDSVNIKQLAYHALIHASKVFIFIFTVTVIINFIIFKVGEDHLGTLFLGHSIFQPVISSFIGLIPNCAASVAITEVFLKGGISFGSAIAGLSSSAGLGLLILLKENHNIKDTAKVIGTLIFISSIAGILIQTIYG